MNVRSLKREKHHKDGTILVGVLVLAHLGVDQPLAEGLPRVVVHLIYEGRLQLLVVVRSTVQIAQNLICLHAMSVNVCQRAFCDWPQKLAMVR